MDAQSWLRSIFGVLGLLAVIPALWVAKGLLSHLVGQLRQTPMGELAANQTVQLILWLALGGLFTKPLLEILGWIQALLSSLILSEEGLVIYGMGTVPPATFSLLTLLLMLAVYGFVIWSGKALFAGNVQISPNIQLSRVEKWFMLLAIASMVYTVIRLIVMRVVLIELPNRLQPDDYGALGFLVAWAVGILLTALVLVILDSQLSKTETMKE